MSEIKEDNVESQEYTLAEVFTDNGESDYYRIVKNDTGENVYSTDEEEDKAKGYPNIINIDLEEPVAHEILEKLANIHSYETWSELMYDSHDQYQVDCTIEALHIYTHNKISKLKEYMHHKDICDLANGLGNTNTCTCGLFDLLKIKKS